jgi:dimethylglycine dehydrogenase
MEAGRPFGIRTYGIKAMAALSIEKSYRSIGRELSIEYCALESGLLSSSTSTRVTSLDARR